MEEVRKIRQLQPCCGGRKLLKMIKEDKPEIKISRNDFFELLRRNGLLVKQKRKRLSFTDYKSASVVFPNLLKDMKVEHLNQVWVSDMTYIRLIKGKQYLFLVTDYCSREIIGYYLSEDMTAKSACKALKMAINKNRTAKHVIHHSDHGSQYSSAIYQKMLKEVEGISSMTGPAHCYDNAVAERVNGILKNEFGLNRTFLSREHVIEAVRSAIMIYNNIRLHKSLGYCTPHKYSLLKRQDIEATSICNNARRRFDNSVNYSGT